MDAPTRYFLEGWPRQVMRIQLAFLPSTMRTAFMLYRFRRLRWYHAPGRDLARARRLMKNRMGIGVGGMLRVALHEILERRPWQVLLMMLAMMLVVGMLIGSVLSAIFGA